MRQKRFGWNRSQRTDKYPLTSNLLLAEFKLRTSAGSKVSKPWFKKKIKSKQAKLNLKEAATGSRDSRKDTA